MEGEHYELRKAQKITKQTFKYTAESDSGLKDTMNKIHQTNKKESLRNRNIFIRINKVVVKVGHFLSLKRLSVLIISHCLSSGS